jgi:hypothetical protein
VTNHYEDSDEEHLPTWCIILGGILVLWCDTR